MEGMDVIIDDEPILEREDRPRSHTWPLPQPPIEVSLAEHDKVETIEETSEPSNEPEVVESQRTEPSNASSRKNSRKNAWGNLSYADLITQAIESSPDKRLTLSQIYEWMVKNIPYFKDKGDSTSSAGWKNSIRHNLSLHSRFMRIQNDQNGKSSYWVINPDAKPGKATRRRSGSVDGAPKTEKKRRSKKLQSCEDISTLSPANSLIFQRKNHSSESPKPTNNTSPSSSTDSLSNLQDLDDLSGNFMFAGDNFSRPRSTSNVSTQSSIGGRLTPIPGEEPEDEISSLASPYLNSLDSGEHGRPRVSSAAEETANLVESMNLGRTSAGDTINLDESLKFDSRLTDISHNSFSTDNLTRVHSDSFSSVQSADSGYESPAYFSSPVQGVPGPVQAPRQQQYLMPGNVQLKPPPPYPNQPQFTGAIRQPSQQLIPRTAGMPVIANGVSMQKGISGHVGYYPQMPSQHCTSQGFIGQQNPQPTQRLQHLPYTNNNNNAYTSVSTTNTYNMHTLGNGSNRNGISALTDPYLQSGGMQVPMKDNRTMYASVPKKAVLAHPTSMVMGPEGQVPSDLSHVELDSFHDQFQLACDLESILRNDMGEAHLDMGFEQPMNSVNPYAVPSMNNNYKVSMNGQSWVH